MKILVDDIREAPAEWKDTPHLVFATPEEFIIFILEFMGEFSYGGSYNNGSDIEEIILDNDMGLDHLSGIQVMQFLYNYFYEKHPYSPQKISCCSANPVAKKKIEDLIKEYQELREKNPYKNPLAESKK